MQFYPRVLYINWCQFVCYKVDIFRRYILNFIWKHLLLFNLRFSNCNWLLLNPEKVLKNCVLISIFLMWNGYLVYVYLKHNSNGALLLISIAFSYRYDTRQNDVSLQVTWKGSCLINKVNIIYRRFTGFLIFSCALIALISSRRWCIQVFMVIHRLRTSKVINYNTRGCLIKPSIIV